MAAVWRRSARLFILLQRHHSCTFTSQNLNHFMRSQKVMTDQSQTDLGLFKPPSTVRGMTELDRSAFNQTVSVPAIRLPTNILNKAVKSLKKVALQRPGLKRVVEEHSEDGNADCGNIEHRLLLLDPNSITSSDSFGSDEAEALKAYSVPQEIQSYELKLTYENFKSEEILRAVLPEGQGVTSGFSRVGHIAHMNLREHQLPYRKLIGGALENYLILYLLACFSTRREPWAHPCSGFSPRTACQTC
nr:tRNA (guanine(37)-N1)-methyltransferase isoform X3 [Danio rerio]|eukprot:XP_009305613.1 tRNA (guanine(37)-N1)-methyltransferase isoform X3 [Danio rerio]